ncbi:hypothetical protein TWF696_008841 [Orbilia brochopaga]|uniref:Uncharacterized protein n=1 Tax=Orbilia brochopaga TaxID=3140254 RepID=A0AAV9UHT3_9PEZI
MDTHAHYKSYNLDFRCLDSSDVLGQVDARILDHDLSNFVIDYGPDNAWCGWDFEADDADALKQSWALPTKDAQRFKTRWIALFHVHRQQEFVTRLLDGYNLSARLRASLLSAPGEGNFEIAERIWHWSSVEHSDKYRVIGYNTLFSLDQLNIPEISGAGGENAAQSKNNELDTGNKDATARKWWTRNPISGQASLNIPDLESTHQKFQPHARTRSSAFAPNSIAEHLQDTRVNERSHLSDIHYHPRMLRLWMWIVLTDDGTVISIHEPFPVHDEDPNGANKSNAECIRRNLRMIVKCLSTVRLPQKADSSSRDTRLAIDDGALLLRKSDGPTSDLLFYYLFDDWYTTWDVVVKRAHPYSEDLNLIKNEDPRLAHIDKLHDIVRRLASLKRIYQSYELVIGRLLEEGKVFFDEKSPLAFQPAAVSRIARLKYRVKYLAITEIEDCELETQGLISLTYNRLNFRETQAVEKLTLLSVALAKVTIVFLPLSLIMAYYSMDVEGITGHSTKRDFWVSVGVALFLTLFFLLMINRLSKAMQTGNRKKL